MKKVCVLFLVLTLWVGLSCPALAANAGEKETAAWSLYQLGLFQGSGVDSEGFPVFDLDKAPNRAQSVTMLVRLLGAEEEAQEGEWETPFTDLPEWAEPYIGYAFAQGLTTGRGGNSFDPDSPVSATEFLTFVLRALGYSSETDFHWDKAWELSDKLGITQGEYPAAGEFLRGDLAWVSCNALEAKPKGNSKTLRQVLGLPDGKDACRWEETVRTCQENRLVLSFAATADSPKTYTKFEVASATVNGVPCAVEQYGSAKEVTDHCKKRTEAEKQEFSLPGAFALAYLRYDEAAAKAAATETVTEKGVEYPVIVLRLHCTGTLPSGKQVEEPAMLIYYINGYSGRF